MASSVNFNQIGFFNSILPLNQTNWASYFSPVIPDGVIAGIDNEMQVFGNSSGMYVYVKSGECRVRSHRGYISEQSTLDIAAADSTYARKDLVVVRVTYGNPSTMEIAVKTGNPTQTPTAPALTQNAGYIWEIPLAEVYVAASAVTITAGDVTDKRFVYANDGMSPITFSGTSLTVENYRSYRNDTAINSLTIALPDSPSDIWKCSVDFNAGSSFSGVSFTKGGSPYTVLSDTFIGAINTRYHLDIFWAGSYYWVIAHTNWGKRVSPFSGTALTAYSGWEYRNSSAIGSLQITLPNSPDTDYITVVCFTSSSSFGSVSFKKGSASYSPKVKGDLLSLSSKRYNLSIWWDGSYYWVNSEAA